MAITATMVKDLREQTGAGMMDCKNALVEAEGCMDKAVDILREKGIAKAGKKADRVASEGIVRIAFSDSMDKASIIEVNSETDFVAKNQEFVDFVEALAEKVLELEENDPKAFFEMSLGEETVKEALVSKIAKIGENLSIRRFEKKGESGVVYHGYVHGNGKIGVLVGLRTDGDKEETKVLGKDLAMQIASMNPKFIKEEDVDKEYLDHEKKVLTQQALNEGKSPEMADKIALGKLKKEIKDICLLEQKFVKDQDLTVKQYVEESAKALGKDISVVSMMRYEAGEGIEKKEEDFLEEVMKQIKE